MDSPRIMHGQCTEGPWITHGQCTESPWTVHEQSQDSVRTPENSLDNPWTLSGFQMGPWTVRGQSEDCDRTSIGLPPDCLWTLSGLCTDSTGVHGQSTDNLRTPSGLPPDYRWTPTGLPPDLWVSVTYTNLLKSVSMTFLREATKVLTALSYWMTLPWNFWWRARNILVMYLPYF